MNINWKRLSITLGIVVLAGAVLGYLMWSGMTKIIQDKEEEINLLANRSAGLSQQYFEKFQAKKAEEAAKTAADNAAPTSKNRNTSTSNGGETGSEETTAQSQILYFYNPSCGACIAQGPIVHEAEAEGIPFAWRDIIAHPDYINQYGITATPTFILNGHRRNFSTKAQLESFWNSYK